jgi:hypothetical protein
MMLQSEYNLKYQRGGEAVLALQITAKRSRYVVASGVATFMLQFAADNAMHYTPKTSRYALQYYNIRITLLSN